jgi:hypothetical protein
VLHTAGGGVPGFLCAVFSIKPNTTLDFYEKYNIITFMNESPQDRKKSSSRKCALLISYREGKGQWLVDWEYNPNKTYSDVFLSDEIKQIYLSIARTRETASIAFISIEKDKINYIARYRRDRIVATNKARVFFDLVLKINKPVPLDFILTNSRDSMKNSLTNIFLDRQIKIINENQWDEIVRSLIKFDSNNKELLDAILLKNGKYDKTNRNYIVSTERDAIGLVLRIADLDEELNDIVKWNITDFDTPHFLKNLNGLNLREDQLIINDFTCFGDLKVIKEYKNTTCTLSNGRNTVSIIYANRTPLENNIGVDLIYYGHNHQTFIFVQYKRLVEENKKYIYRANNDKSLIKELDRMNNLKTHMIEDKHDYRINDEVFYFKFCKEKQDIYTKDLCQGFYLPKDFFDLIYSRQKKENKSVVFSYDVVERYLNNTLFIELIKSGLIGTKYINANSISKVIKETLESGKSLILATNKLKVL